jgi:sec-independent protein translocase protein TatA
LGPPLQSEENIMTPLFAIFELSPIHLLILLGIGILLFGKRLPDVGRSLGKGIVEFKKGLRGLEDEVDTHASTNRPETPAIEPPRPPQRVPTTAPKFEENVTNIQPPPAV